MASYSTSRPAADQLVFPAIPTVLHTIAPELRHMIFRFFLEDLYRSHLGGPVWCPTYSDFEHLRLYEPIMCIFPHEALHVLRRMHLEFAEAVGKASDAWTVHPDMARCITRFVDVEGEIRSANYLMLLVQSFPNLTSVIVKHTDENCTDVSDESELTDMLAGRWNQDVANSHTTHGRLGGLVGSMSVGQVNNVTFLVSEGLGLGALLEDYDLDEDLFLPMLDGVLYVEVDAFTGQPLHHYIGMVDPTERNHQSDQHSSIDLVPANEVTLRTDVAFLALVHTSGKVRSLIGCPTDIDSMDPEVFTEESLVALEDYNLQVYEDLSYARR